MSQSDNALHLSEDRRSAFLPCGCGDDDDRIRLHHDDDPNETIWVTASFAPRYTISGRLCEAWRALRGRPHNDCSILSRSSVVALRDWLTERLVAPAAAPNPEEPSQ